MLAKKGRQVTSGLIAEPANQPRRQNVCERQVVHDQTNKKNDKAVLPHPAGDYLND
jgi:hypothetical protein